MKQTSARSHNMSHDRGHSKSEQKMSGFGMKLVFGQMELELFLYIGLEFEWKGSVLFSNGSHFLQFSSGLDHWK